MLVHNRFLIHFVGRYVVIIWNKMFRCVTELFINYLVNLCGMGETQTRLILTHPVEPTISADMMMMMVNLCGSSN